MKHSKHQIQMNPRLCCAALAAVAMFTIGSNVALVQRHRDAEALAAKYKQQLIEATDLNKKYDAKIKDLKRTIDEYANEAAPDTNIVGTPRYFDVPLSVDLQDYIYSLCCTYNIEESYELVYAMIKQESQFDAAAISPTDDYGLMQINKGNHAWLREELGIVDFLDPYDNVHAGIYMISSLIHKYDGNLADALMAYNLGEGNARKLWRRGVHTTSYTELVLGYYMQFIENI